MDLMYDVSPFKCHKSLIFINKIYIYVISITLLLILSSCGNKAATAGVAPQINSQNEESSEGFSSYQIGPTWDAQVINGHYLRQKNDFLTSKIALSTLKISGPSGQGTGFFLGKFNNQFLVATSAHVLKNVPICMAIPVYAHFQIINKTYRCNKIIGIWSDIDLAIFTIDEDRDDDTLSKTNPLSFDFNESLEKGTQLMTMGFGSYENSDGELTLKEDRDCIVYSPTGIVKAIQKDDKSIDAFATGCDISEGDSGSAVVNKATGKVMGLIWATSSPKPLKITTDAYLDSLLASDSSDVWNYFSYAVSTGTIKERLLRWCIEVDRGGFGLQRRVKTVYALLGI